MLQLKPHQIEGIDTLVRRARVGDDRIPHFLLADQQRVGKCAQGLVAAEELSATRVLVLCKAIGVENWYSQWRMWTPGSFRMKVFSYQMYTRNAAVRREARKFAPQIIILDECQMLKNAAAKITQFVYGTDCEGDGLVADAQIVWLMSGTPSSNNAGELWTHLRALFDWPYDYYDHISRFTRWEMGDHGPRFFGNRKEHLPEIRDFLARISLRRLFRDVNPEAGDPVWNMISLTASAAALAQVHRAERDAGVGTLLARLQAAEVSAYEPDFSDMETQLATLRRITGMAKAPLVADYVHDLFKEDNKEHVLVGAWHRDVMDILEEQLTKRRYRVLRIDGRTSRKMKLAIEKEWRAGKADITIGQLDACGTSVDLSRSDVCVLAESAWGADVNSQFVFRCLNVAKPEMLPVDVCGLAGSSDEGVQRVNARKGEQETQLWGRAA